LDSFHHLLGGSHYSICWIGEGEVVGGRFHTVRKLRQKFYDELRGTYYWMIVKSGKVY
jgi:hypothetical protein